MVCWAKHVTRTRKVRSEYTVLGVEADTGLPSRRWVGNVLMVLKETAWLLRKRQ
jgi:hypothetical protein